MRKESYENFEDYLADCLQAIENTTLSVVHLTELPESFDIAVNENWPPMPKVCILTDIIEGFQTESFPVMYDM